MIEFVHLLILRIAATLTPSDLRSEWLSEWRVELWYASREQGRSTRCITAFCLGAFRDALWLRRNTGLPRFYGSLRIDSHREEAHGPLPEQVAQIGSARLRSPFHCLALLTIPVVVALIFACLLPGPQAVLFPSPNYPFPGLYGHEAHPMRALSNLLLSLFAFAWMIVPVTTSLALRPASKRLRFWAFFAAKILLIFLAVSVCAIDIVTFPAPGSPPAVQLLLFCTVCALRWALNDQRSRCPICLTLLDKPVHIGNRSRTFLEWSGTELICLKGHGMLHVPGSPAIWFSTPRWTDLDPSWRSLFPSTKV